MIILPVLVWWKTQKDRIGFGEYVGLKRTNILPGLGVGVLMGGVILSGYYLFFGSVIDPRLLQEKVSSLGLREYYWGMAVVVSVGNSLFEEYYWRGFIINELKRWFKSTLTLCIVGGFLFGLHHICVLLPIFDWKWALVFTAGTMAAGGVWSWMRMRGYSILDCYISHIMADSAIMWIGYDLIKNNQ